MTVVNRVWVTGKRANQLLQVLGNQIQFDNKYYQAQIELGTLVDEPEAILLVFDADQPAQCPKMDAEIKMAIGIGQGEYSELIPMYYEAGYEFVPWDPLVALPETGLARIKECLECHTWPAMELKQEWDDFF